jgi:hypothetical protein
MGKKYKERDFTGGVDVSSTSRFYRWWNRRIGGYFSSLTVSHRYFGYMVGNFS